MHLYQELSQWFILSLQPASEDLFCFVTVFLALPAFRYSGRPAYLYTAAIVHQNKRDHFNFFQFFGNSFDAFTNLC